MHGSEKYAQEQVKETKLFNDIYDVLENTVQNIENGTFSGGEEKPNPEIPEDPTRNWDKTKVDVKYDENGKIIPVPKGFTPSNLEGEKNIDTGYVIKQNGTDNEFVWVPIVSGYEFGKLYDFGTKDNPKNEVIVATATGNREPDILTNATHGDASASRGDGDALGERGLDLLKSVVGLTGSDDKILADWKIQLENEYARMRKSVTTYGGFYIGRYETGFEDSIKATTRKNNAPENIGNQNWYQMYQKSKNIARDLSIESTMIWGCEWDAVMQWFLQSKDPSIVKYVRDSSEKVNNLAVPVATGSNVKYSANNIYDMAGNSNACTLEASDTCFRGLRGCEDIGTIGSVSFRMDRAYYIYTSVELVGSRCTLVI